MGVYRFLWMLVSGALLPSRGAVFPALQSLGLEPAAVRHAWAAFRYGKWHINSMLQTWRTYVEAQGDWQARQYAGYYVKAVDITAYWRPTLAGLQSQHYDAQAGRALPAVVFGLVGRVGAVAEQRLALLTDLLRAELTDPSERALQTELVTQVAAGLAEDEIPVFDAGFKISALQAAALPRFVIRLAKNFTARRNVLPDSAGGRPPEYGAVVRPLARTYAGRRIERTPPDHEVTWQQHGLDFRAEFWYGLVLRDCKVSAAQQTFTVVAIYTPGFTEPWFLPFTYTWEASGQTPVVRPGQGLTDTVMLAWDTPGTQVITVTVANATGAAWNTHTVVIGPGYHVYLPLVTRDVSVSPPAEIQITPQQR